MGLPATVTSANSGRRRGRRRKQSRGGCRRRRRGGTRSRLVRRPLHPLFNLKSKRVMMACRCCPLLQAPQALSHFSSRVRLRSHPTKWPRPACPAESVGARGLVPDDWRIKLASVCSWPTTARLFRPPTLHHPATAHCCTPPGHVGLASTAPNLCFHVHGALRVQLLPQGALGVRLVPLPPLTIFTPPPWRCLHQGPSFS